MENEILKEASPWRAKNRDRRSIPLRRARDANRVLRIRQIERLTLERHTARRPGRTHDGAVVALRSNIRWCSDHLAIHARNSEVVRALFVIDACDHEIIAWSTVANAGVSGEMVRDLMVPAVEKRFGATRTPHLVEWLSDNDSAYEEAHGPMPLGPIHIQAFPEWEVLNQSGSGFLIRSRFDG